MSEAWIGLLAAVITGICSLIGVVLANNSNRKLIVYRIDELEKKVDKHNNLIERMTKQVAQFVGDRDPFDDLTMLCVKLRASEDI